jgi:hypothetical protein
MEMNAFEFIGPPLEAGPLPAVFYFALSASDSLHLAPYNQPALILASHSIRVFSISLPHHVDNPHLALKKWAEALKNGEDIISSYCEKIKQLIESLVQKNIILPGRIGVMGLSRGGLIACLVAAKIAYIPYILGFAPVTTLNTLHEFQDLDVSKFNLINNVKDLSNRALRFYIGNRDLRVGTANCMQLIQNLVEDANKQTISSAPIELIVSPSIGHQGHGTSPEIFKNGAYWLACKLEKTHAT